MRNNKNKGFTLVELLVVIAILAILATVSVVGYTSFIKSAYISNDENIAAQLNQFMAALKADSNSEYYGQKITEDNIYEVTQQILNDGGLEGKLVPQSLEYGYHIYFKFDGNGSGEYIVMQAGDVAPQAGYKVFLTAIAGGETTPASKPGIFEKDGVKYFLVDTEGSAIANFVKAFYTLDHLKGETTTEKLREFFALVEEVEAEEAEHKADYSSQTALLENTVFITDEGKIASTKKDSYTNVIVPEPVVEDSVITVTTGVTILDKEDSTKDTTEATCTIVANNDMTIELPANVEIPAGSLHIEIVGENVVVTIVFDASTWEDLIGPEGTESTEDHAKIDANFTNKDVMIEVGGEKYQLADTPASAETETIVNNKVVKVDDNEHVATLKDNFPVTEFTIQCEGAVNSVNTGRTYFDKDNGILYLAYVPGAEYTLFADNFNSNASKKQVIWSGSANIDANGKFTIPTLGDTYSTTTSHSFVVTATANVGTDKELSKSITVVLDRITQVSVSGFGVTLDSNNTNNNTINVIYNTGDSMSFLPVVSGTPIFTPGKVKYDSSTDAKVTVKLEEPTTGETAVFEEDSDKENYIKFISNGKGGVVEGTQRVTISVGGHIKETFVITVKDNTASPFSTNLIYDDINIGEKYLFRVGNDDNTPIALGTLFNCENVGASINVTVDVNTYNEEGAISYTYDNTNSDWTKHTLDFDGTGVAVITISNSSYSQKLTVEVVNAQNVTVASQISSSKDNVLLKNITLTSGTVALSGNTLWGNGFTFNIENGQHNTTGIIVMQKGARLDNTRIVGDIYTQYGSTYQSDYSAAAVAAYDGSIITNCYIANCKAPLNTMGSVRIENTTIEGGRFANIEVSSGTLTLKDVTTINQEREGMENVLGFGIVVPFDTNASTSIIIEGSLTQYNFIGSDAKDKGYLPNHQYIGTLYNKVFSNDFKSIQFTDENGKTYVHTGIVFMNDSKLLVNVPSNYLQTPASTSMSVGLESKTAYVFAYDNSIYSFSNDAFSLPVWTPSTQGVIAPSYSFDHIKNNSSIDENNFCNYLEGQVNISVDQGKSFDWDTSILTATKAGESLKYTVTMNGTDYTGKKIVFSTPGDYVVTYTYTDTNNFRVNGSNIEQYSVTYTKTVLVHVVAVKPNAKNAAFDFNGYGSKVVPIGDKYYVMPDVSATVDGKIGSTVIDGTTVYYIIAEAYNASGASWDNGHNGSQQWCACFPVFYNVVTITDYNDGGIGDAVVYDKNTKSLPTGLEALNPTTTFQYGMKPTAPATPTEKYGYLAYTSDNSLTNNDRNETNVLATYKYEDNAGKTYYYLVNYHCPSHKGESGCVTGDTLVTLADGTQKEIRDVTAEDILLVWNHFTGKYDTVPAAIIFNHGYDYNTVIKLNFSDGTQVKMINLHQFLDADLNKYVTIDSANVQDYVGHNFVKQDGDSYTTVTLESYEISEEYIEAYGIISALHYNFLVEGMFSTDFMKDDYDLFNYFAMGEDLMFDTEQMQNDIDTYGLYTYEDFADYLTYEQFVGFNVQYFKIAVGRGYYTYEGILDLIAEYLNK